MGKLPRGACPLTPNEEDSQRRQLKISMAPNAQAISLWAFGSPNITTGEGDNPSSSLVRHITPDFYANEICGHSAAGEIASRFCIDDAIARIGASSPRRWRSRMALTTPLMHLLLCHTSFQ